LPPQPPAAHLEVGDAVQRVCWAPDGRCGKCIEGEAGFWHSSDLDPCKPINWQRRIAPCGEYGCMGDKDL